MYQIHSLILGASAALFLFLYQFSFSCVALWFGWMFACSNSSPPSMSSKNFWILMDTMVFKVPSYITVLAISLWAISVTLTCSNWIIFYWATKNNVCNRGIFREDVTIILWITFFFVFIGLMIIAGSFPIHFGEDRSQLDKSFIASVGTMLPILRADLWQSFFKSLCNLQGCT